MENKNSMFDEFRKVMSEIQKGDKESAMIVLERKPWGENKHAMVGDIVNQVILLEWGIHMIAEGCNYKFEDVMKLIEIKHKNTSHYMENVYCGDIKSSEK